MVGHAGVEARLVNDPSVVGRFEVVRDSSFEVDRPHSTVDDGEDDTVYGPVWAGGGTAGDRRVGHGLHRPRRVVMLVDGSLGASRVHRDGATCRRHGAAPTGPAHRPAARLERRPGCTSSVSDHGCSVSMS